MSEKNILEIKGIEKSFSGVKVLNNVDFELCKGEIHALVGENGAGKSTLMNIISGVVKKDKGEVIYDGRVVDFQSTREAHEAGISFIHQEFSLLSYLTVAQNIFLGNEPTNKLGLVNKKELNKRAKEVLKKTSTQLDVNIKVNEISAAQKQLVEIAKAISLDANIIIMDEPTSSLTETEIETLFKIMEELSNEGKSIIFISHKLDEVLKITDRVTVLRDGVIIGTEQTEKLDIDKIIKQMIGRNLDSMFSKSEHTVSEKYLEVINASGNRFNEVSFYAKKGEVLGFAGLVGAGRTELIRGVFGADKLTSGDIYLNQKKIKMKSPDIAIKHGLGLIPEDRKEQGLILDMNINNNINLVSLRNLKSLGLINEKDKVKRSKEMVESLQVKSSSLFNKVRSLSGGNQQKVVIAKWLLQKPNIIILDEPTRGIDVGSKAEIYSLVDELAQSGITIIVISSEMTELMGMCDRIYVLKNGKINGEFYKDEITEQNIMEAMIKGA